MGGTKRRDTISALRIYLTNGEDSVEDLAESPPTPWSVDTSERCRVAFANNPKFRDARAVPFWRELGPEDSKSAAEDKLLGELRKAGYSWCVVEDVARLRAERESIDKIKRGLDKTSSKKIEQDLTNVRNTIVRILTRYPRNSPEHQAAKDIIRKLTGDPDALMKKISQTAPPDNK